MLLLEDCVGEFVTDRKTIQESSQNGRNFLKIAGRLSLCDTLNGNNRIYPRGVWERQFAKDSRLMELIERNRSVGLLEHPKDGQVSLLSPISHLLIDAKLQENGEVFGELLIINTPEGSKLRALIEAGYNPLVSSRGYGSIEKDKDGRDIVQDDYVCEGWDVVFHPSFKQCELEAVVATESTEAKPTRSLRESAESNGVNMWNVYQVLAEKNYSRSWSSLSPAEQDVVAEKANQLPLQEKQQLEAAFASKKLTDAALKEHAISGQAAPPKPALVEAASSPSKPNITQTMDAIRTKLNSVAALEPTKLNPSQLSESRNQLRGLHNEVAKWQAEDASRSWEAGQLHEAIKDVEARWDQAITQPRQESSRLLNERQKTLSVLSATVDTAKLIKKNLTEAVRVNGKLSSVNAKLLEAVRAWKAEAEKFQKLAAINDDKYNLACESLDIMSDQWKRNTTELGRKIVELELPEGALTPEVAKRLAEATHPDDVADIRESLLPKADGKTVVTEGKKPEPAAAKSAAKPLNESTPATVAAKPAATAEGKPADTALKTLAQPKFLKAERNPGSLKESVAIARRLSGRSLLEAAPAA